MSETVFILGAGASKEAGAPLMNDFLDVADDLRKRQEVGDATADFDLVFKGITALQLVHAKARIGLENIESVFAAFEMAKLLGRLASLNAEEINRLPIAMRRVIEKTLERTVDFPTSGGQVPPPEPYDSFAKLIEDIHTSKVSIITFNYDVCLDYAFNWQRTPVDYCLDDGKDKSGLKLLKLHGSLNWTRCPGCGKVVPWYISDFFKNRNWNLWLTEAKKVHLDIASKIGEFKHCGNSTAKEPMVVPPTWNKAQYHDQLELVWRAAAAELADAENIFISGYSLPSTDQFFRYLYAIGTVGISRLKRFWVFDPDKNVGDKFSELLGPVASSRFKIHPKTFKEAVPIIRSELVRRGVS